MDVIARAVEEIGSGADVARLCGIKPQMVSQWVHGIRPVSPRCALLIESHPKVTVTRYDLRPDVFGKQERVA